MQTHWTMRACLICGDDKQKQKELLRNFAMWYTEHGSEVCSGSEELVELVKEVRHAIAQR